MHDLNELNKLNAERFAQAIHNYRAQGRFVIAEYSGLTLMAIETFSTEKEAFDKFGTYSTMHDSTHAKLYFPGNDPQPRAIMYPPVKAAEAKSSHDHPCTSFEYPAGHGVSPRGAPKLLDSEAVDDTIPFTQRA